MFYRRKKSEENFIPITETDERYLELLKLKKKIRKVEIQAKTVLDNTELLVERKKLMADLDELKKKQAEEFLGYLELL